MSDGTGVVGAMLAAMAAAAVADMTLTATVVSCQVARKTLPKEPWPMGRRNRSVEKSISCTRVAIGWGWFHARSHAAASGCCGAGWLASRMAERAASTVSSSERASLMLNGCLPGALPVRGPRCAQHLVVSHMGHRVDAAYRKLQGVVQRWKGCCLISTTRAFRKERAEAVAALGACSRIVHISKEWRTGNPGALASAALDSTEGIVKRSKAYE